MGDEQAIRDSFVKVKQDFDNQENKINSLKEELDSLKNQVVDYLPKLLEQNNLILKRIEVLEQGIIKKEDPLKEQIITKFKRNKKEVIKQKILEISSEKDTTVSSLRDKIVKELKFCSRASFYRYLEELKDLNLIGILEINGREYVKIVSQLASH
jgi:hypothetical protein